MFSFPSRAIALDEEYLTELTSWDETASGVKHKPQTVNRCIVPMLADFHILPRDQHRLLIDCDIFSGCSAVASVERPRAGAVRGVARG